MSKEEKKVNKFLNNGLKKMDKLKHEDAIKEFTNAVAINSQFIPAWVNMIKSVEKLRRKEKYLEVLELMAKGEPRNKEPWDQLGKIFIRLKDQENIVKSYKKVVELDPKDIQAWNHLALAYESIKQYKDAINCYDKIIRIDSKNVDSLFNSARINHDMLKKYQEAISRFERVLKLQPDNKDAWYNIADSWFMLNEFQKAIENAQKVIELDTKYQAAWQILTASKDRIEPDEVPFWRKSTWNKLRIISEMKCGQCDKKILESAVGDKFEYFTDQEHTNFYFCNTCRIPYHAIPCMEQLKVVDSPLATNKIAIICKNCGSLMAGIDKSVNKSLVGVYDNHKKEFINMIGAQKVAMGRSGERSFINHDELKGFYEAIKNESTSSKILDVNSLNKTKLDEIKRIFTSKNIVFNISELKIYKFESNVSNITQTTCGNCHAPLDISVKTEFHFCTYCNAVHIS